MSRADDARRMAELAEAAAAGEAVKAQALIDAFVADARQRGIAPVPLEATSPRGSKVRTGLRGWYLRRNRALGISDDGGYYILTLAAEPTIMERLRGVQLHPTRPSLVVGRGGRDGESGDLADFLAAALDSVG